jgi:hypothetical protein
VWRKLLVSEFFVGLDAVVEVLIVKGFSEHHDSALECDLFVKLGKFACVVCHL